MGNRKRCATCGITCFRKGGTPVLSWPGGSASPGWEYANLGLGCLQLDTGVKPTWDWGTLTPRTLLPLTGLGYPLGRELVPVTGVPPGKDIKPLEVLWDGTEYQTDNITFRHPSDTGGKNISPIFGCGRSWIRNITRNHINPFTWADCRVLSPIFFFCSHYSSCGRSFRSSSGEGLRYG